MTAKERRWDLFVWDWDGTIMDTTGLIALGLQQAVEKLGLTPVTFEKAKSTIGLGFFETMQVICPELPEKDWGRFQQAYKDWYLVREADVLLFPHLSELLIGMHENGLRMAVATGKSRAGLDRVFKKTGIGSLFEATRTADECASKPAPDMLEELSIETGVPCERMVMIGDTGFDLLMAKKAHCDAVGVTYGAGSRKDLMQVPSLGLADNVDELAKILGVDDVLTEKLLKKHQKSYN